MKKYCIILFFCFPTCLFSQNLKFKSFSFPNGLNAVNIRKAIEDKYGFIWIGTQDGLFRFDGLVFDILKKGGVNKAICQNYISDLCYDGNNYLYVASYEGGLDRVDVSNMEIKHLICIKANQNEWNKVRWATKILLDDNNNIWVASPEGLVKFSLKNQNISKVFLDKENTNFRDISILKKIAKNNILVGCNNYGIITINSINAKVINTQKEFFQNTQKEFFHIVDIALNNKGCFIALSDKILEGEFKNYNWRTKKIYLFDKKNTSTINTISIDDSCNLFIATSDGLKLKKKLAENIVNVPLQLSSKNNLASFQGINNVFIDGKKNLWLSTNKELLVSTLINNGIESFTGINSTPMPHLYSMLQKDEKEIFTTGIDGLFVTNLQTSISLKISKTNTVGRIHYIFQFKNDEYIVSTDDGMYYYNSVRNIFSQKVFLERFPEWKDFVKNYFNNSVSYNQKIYWASEEQEGIIIWDLNKHIINQVKANSEFSHGLHENNVHNIKIDKDGFMWIMCNMALYKYDLKKDLVIDYLKFELGKEKQLNSSIFYDIYDDSLNLWIATYGGGINVYNKKNKTWKYITEENGLCNNSVYALLPQKDSFLWASTNMGLSKINLLSGSCTNFFQEDGLHSNSFEEKGSLLFGQKIYFAGIDGFTQITPSQVHNDNISTKLVLKKIEIFSGDSDYVNNRINTKNIILPPSTNAFILHLSIPDFKNKARYKIFYKFRNQRNYLQVNENRKIEINGVHYGNYILDIKYRDANNKDLLIDNFITIKILPKWHQTVLFKISVALLIAALLYILYSFRIKQLKKVLAVRQKISQNLHDDIGSTLSAINMYTQVAKLQPQANDFIDSIEENTQDALGKLDDIIWRTNPKNDKIKNLVERMDGFARPLLQAKNITFQFTHTNTIDEQKIGEATRQNLFIIFKEAINNVAKYAECKNCIVILEEKNKQISCSITDDGKGFDTSKPSERNGILNMQLRAKDLKGNCTIESILGKGTKVMVHLPV